MLESCIESLILELTQVKFQRASTTPILPFQYLQCQLVFPDSYIAQNVTQFPPIAPIKFGNTLINVKFPTFLRQGSMLFKRHFINLFIIVVWFSAFINPLSDLTLYLTHFHVICQHFFMSVGSQATKGIFEELICILLYSVLLLHTIVGFSMRNYIQRTYMLKKQNAGDRQELMFSINFE